MNYLGASITDWVQAIAVVFSLWLSIKTLRRMGKRDVQRDEQISELQRQSSIMEKSFALERQRVLAENRPYFMFQDVKYTKDSFHFQLQNMGKTAILKDAKGPVTKEIELTYNSGNNGIIKTNEWISVFGNVISEIPAERIAIQFSLIYTDILETRYEQDFKREGIFTTEAQEPRILEE